MTRFRLLTIAAAALICLAVAATFTGSSTASGLDRKATVRLYSAGNVVAVWEADGPGQMDGPSYVFTTLQGTQRLEVRVSGTYSVEEKR